MNSGIQAVVFDLDGTLVDSAPDLHRVLNALLADDGLAPLDLETVRLMIGGGVPNLVRRGFEAAGRSLESEALDGRVRAYLALYAQDPVRLTRVYPGVRETLSRIEDAGFRLGVCTNKAHALAVAVLDQLALARYFRAVVGGDSAPERKPDPAPLLATLERLGTSPQRAVLVGDGPADAEMARRAAVPIILMSYGYSHGPVQDLHADVVLDRFTDLPPALAGLGLDGNGYS